MEVTDQNRHCFIGFKENATNNFLELYEKNLNFPSKILDNEKNNKDIFENKNLISEKKKRCVIDGRIFNFEDIFERRLINNEEHNKNYIKNIKGILYSLDKEMNKINMRNDIKDSDEVNNIEKPKHFVNGVEKRIKKIISKN